MGVHRHPIVYCQPGSGGNFQIWDGARTNKDKIGFDRPTVRPSVANGSTSPGRALGR